MIKITRIQRNNEDGSIEFGTHIPIEVMPVIISAGISALVAAGAVVMQNMSEEEFTEQQKTLSDGSVISEEEMKMWGEFMQAAKPGDLPNA